MHVYETVGCMYADVGRMSMKRMGACMRLLVDFYETVGGMYADVGCMSMKRLGACMRMLGVCL